MRILVAEDVADTRELMKLLLEYHGHEVDTAANGQLALDAVAKRLPDIILMDLRMPVMDGFTAVRQLRQAPDTRTVPIIAVSAYLHDSAWRDRAKEVGCNDCIGKPIDYDQLERMLQQFA